MALHTSRRYGSPIRPRWSDHAVETISLKQNSTKALAQTHVSQTLRRMRDVKNRVGPYILTREDGCPWFAIGDDKALSHRRATQMVACGLHSAGWSDPSQARKGGCPRFNDRRRAAVTLHAKEGTGFANLQRQGAHRLPSAHRIPENHLAMAPVLSGAAIITFENGTATACATGCPSAGGHAIKTDPEHEEISG